MISEYIPISESSKLQVIQCPVYIIPWRRIGWHIVEPCRTSIIFPTKITDHRFNPYKSQAKPVLSLRNNYTNIVDNIA